MTRAGPQRHRKKEYLLKTMIFFLLLLIAQTKIINKYVLLALLLTAHTRLKMSHYRFLGRGNLYSGRCVLTSRKYIGLLCPSAMEMEVHHQTPTAPKAPTHNELRTRRPMW